MEDKEILEMIEEKDDLKEYDVLALEKSIKIDGVEVKEIKYNLDLITGKTIRTAIQKLGRLEMPILNIEYSPVLHAFLFAEAAKLDYHIIEKLGMKDYKNAIEIVSNFM